MSKEEYYDRIKKWLYIKFDELKVIESLNGNNLFFKYKNQKYCDIRIQKNSGIVFYYYMFSEKFFNRIRLKEADFEIILSKWIEDRFQIKVTKMVKRIVGREIIVD